MTWNDHDVTNPLESGALSRRRAVKLGGGGLAALSALWLVGRSANASAQEATPTDCAPTTPAENKAIAEEYLSAWGAGDADRLQAVLAPDYQHHWGTSEEAASADEMIAQYREFAAAFPNMQLTINALVAEGDLVVGYSTVTATQVADFQGMPAVDMQVSWGAFNLFRISCGLVAESWNESDHLGRLIQNGTITPEEISSVGTPTP